ncbi:MAG: radical SAM protein [Bacteroidetes bacterium]|nr:radical SAM protein [Bacteroidota bacterium]MBU1115763.1 radical SAM protein [Bacteroidota bacterium]MBU1799449.1 radical SAM protein [Bacteroidota bacterium]
MEKLLEILNKSKLSKEDITYLLSENDVEKRAIIQKASASIISIIPKDYHSLEQRIDISNYCNADCLFCKSRNSNNKINRFRLNREEIIKKAIELHKNGCNSILLHSGYDNYYNTDRIAYIIYSIKQIAKIKIILSFGLRELEEYKEWKIAGADSYYLNIISKNNNLYNETNSWNSFENRVEHIAELKKLGYNVGSGSIIGLPNQTCSDLAEDIYFVKKLNLNYVDFCHFNSVRSVHDDIDSEEFIRRGIEVSQIVNADTNVRLNDLIN